VSVRSVDLEVDVTQAAGLGEPASLALTVTVPEDTAGLPDDPVLCFAKPGAGYSRRYFTEDLPGPAGWPPGGSGSQAGWHAARGWIVVSVDHLGIGDSSRHDGALLRYTPVVAAAQAAETEVRQKLAAGTLVEGLPPIGHPVVLGIGQSMGGALSIVQQGRYHCYDGLGVLGYSALHTQPDTAPGTPPLVLPWAPRDTGLADAVFTNGPALAEVTQEGNARAIRGATWSFHYDDVDPDVVRSDTEGYPSRHGNLPPWATEAIPGTVALWCAAPGAVLAEAAAVRCPVLVAFGERDVLPDPRGEPRAYQSTDSVDLFECPRMAHMHNFAGTRELFWRRIETWAAWVRAVREAREAGVPAAAS
jgi:alpha-beta hydrolase superfamily lysophospholipase